MAAFLNGVFSGLNVKPTNQPALLRIGLAKSILHLRCILEQTGLEIDVWTPES